MQILESCGFGAEYGLDVLTDKSLVFISEYDKIEMHDLIEDMGKYIVKMQKDSRKPSRIWDVEDFEEAMVDNTGTVAVEAIWIPHYIKLCFSEEAMKNMRRLRIICIQGLFFRSDSIEYLSNNLCWFVWLGYPSKLLPQNFNPTRLVHLNLAGSSLHHLWNETKQLPSLRWLYLCGSENLRRTSDFAGMQNLEYLGLSKCTSLEEVHDSLRCSRKLIELNLNGCVSLERFPYVNVESLKSLNLCWCFSLEKLPEFLGIMKPQAHLTELYLYGMHNLVSLQSSICKLKELVKLIVFECSKLESLLEEIGGLENLKVLEARDTLISRPPSSITQLNKLKLLTFAKEKSEDRANFVFPQVNEGLLSLEELDLSYCNLIDGGLPEDIASLSSLKFLNLSGNNFEHLPRSIVQLSALRTLNLSNCKRLKELPGIPQQLNTIHADWSSDSIYNSLFQNISSLQHDISASDSLSLRVFKSWPWHMNIPSWFHHQGMGASVSVNLPKNWYVSDNFLGFVVCYSGKLNDDIIAHLDPLCDDGMSSMTQKFALSNHSGYAIHFLLVPLAGLWDESKANGKTPNDYGCFRKNSPKSTKSSSLFWSSFVV